MTLHEMFDSIREELIEVPGLEWKVTTYQIKLVGVSNDPFASFTPLTCAVTIDDSYRANKKWMVSPSYKTQIGDTHYNTGKGMIKRLNLILESARTILIADEVSRSAAKKQRNASLAKLKPYIDEYGEIFDVDTHGAVHLRYEGFFGIIDLENETIDMASGSWTSNWVPLHMAIPFMKEVALFKLLD
ncbi:hypothetical protein [Vibrio phage PJN101]|nr:hypothetical protein [Vibrio phage PJN101]